MAQKTKNERDIEILEWNIAECDRLIAEYTNHQISDAKIKMQQDKKAKHEDNLKKYKP